MWSRNEMGQIDNEESKNNVAKAAGSKIIFFVIFYSYRNIQANQIFKPNR